ncbi:MAG: Holliday junction branch migration protein RuvA [Candidatus Wildermuthbacteria bacterium]|nr:Holliday junction branch migration protein RuvA [Candidatus Wildermuthbacteria bacterium]
MVDRPSVGILRGVGFKVFVSERTGRELGGDETIRLFCHLRIRQEEAIDLYGFLNQETLEFFEVLLSVQGIGPKAALTICSLGSTQELSKAIQEGDEAFFSRVKGIGQKRVKKIILELSGKLIESSGAPGAKDEEAVGTLVSLGFTRQEAVRSLADVESNLDAKEKIKLALRNLRAR